MGGGGGAWCEGGVVEMAMKVVVVFGGGDDGAMMMKMGVVERRRGGGGGGDQLVGMVMVMVGWLSWGDDDVVGGRNLARGGRSDAGKWEDVCVCEARIEDEDVNAYVYWLGFKSFGLMMNGSREEGKALVMVKIWKQGIEACPNDGIMVMYVIERSREPSGTAFQPPDWPPAARLDGSEVFGFLFSS
ncbi:hypothetical protein Tco_1145430 [Tanacetum coccineum]